MLAARGTASRWPAACWRDRLLALACFVLCAAGLAVGSPMARTAAAPADVGSCRAGHWQSVGGRVLVWWRTDGPNAARDHARAIALAQALNGQIWVKLTALMGLPVSDGAERCNGGDGRLDVWLTPLPQGTNGQTLPYIGVSAWLQKRPCPAVPVYIELDPTRATRSVAAHEFMHAVQLAHPASDTCDTYYWLREATATWAMDYVYPRDDEEHKQKSGLAQPWIPLENPIVSRGQWTFFYYLTKTQPAGAGLIPRIFQLAGSQSSLQAVDMAIPGGFERQYPLYALYAWNQPPVGQSLAQAPASFLQWDRFGVIPLAGTNKPLRPIVVALGPAAPLLDGDINSLAREYSQFTFDPGVRSVTIANGWAGDRGASLQAMLSTPDGWKLEDWSGQPTIHLCFDNPGEDVQELIVVAANSATDFELTGASRSTIEATAACSGYAGTFTGKAAKKSPSGTVTASWTGTATFGTPTPSTAGSYPLASAQVIWTVSGTMHAGPSNCTASGSGTLDLAGASGSINASAQGYRITIDTSNAPPAESELPFTWSGSPSCPSQNSFGNALWLDTPGAVAPHGDLRELTGQVTIPGRGEQVSFSWRFRHA